MVAVLVRGANIHAILSLCTSFSHSIAAIRPDRKAVHLIAHFAIAAPEIEPRQLHCFVAPTEHRLEPSSLLSEAAS